MIRVGWARRFSRCIPTIRSAVCRRHVGLVVLFDAETGMPIAVMDAAEITAYTDSGGERGCYTCACASRRDALGKYSGPGEQAADAFGRRVKVRDSAVGSYLGSVSRKSAELCGAR